MQSLTLSGAVVMESVATVPGQFRLNPHLLSNTISRFHLSFLFTITLATLTKSYVLPEIRPSHIPYSQHCGHIVPESNLSGPISTFRSMDGQTPHFDVAYVRHGDQNVGSTFRTSASFSTRQVFKTHTDGVLNVKSTLRLRVIRDVANSVTHRKPLGVYGGDRGIGALASYYGSARFDLSGYWLMTTGQICMVGSGTQAFRTSGNSVISDVVFKMNYPYNYTITSSLFSGTLESLSSEGSDGYFKPIFLMGFAGGSYKYTLVKSAGSNEVFSKNGSLKVHNVHPVTCFNLFSLSDNYVLKNESPCNGENCSFLDRLFGFVPKYMSIIGLDCSHPTMSRVLFGFSENNSISSGYRLLFDPSRTLVAEGLWVDKRELSFSACRILNAMNSSDVASVGDCSIRINLTIPTTLSIRNRSLVDGQIWSNKIASEPGYFDKVQVHTSGNRRVALPSMTYQYTLTQQASKYCAEKKRIKQKGIHYVNALSSDMKFDLQVKDKNGQVAQGHASPLFVGMDQFMRGLDNLHYYRGRVPFINHFQVVGPAESAKRINSAHAGLYNVSYRISFASDSDLKLGSRIFSKNLIDIAAEGIYNTETGHLCLIGCLADANVSKPMDCEIFVSIHMPALSSNAAAKGTIESKREKSDPLYFENLELTSTSMTKAAVVHATWRMDFEITMALLSNTLVCIFVGLQLFYVKRHPGILPPISVFMLMVLTLGHMIPLLLNFDAFQSRHSGQHLILESGGWLEVNEVLVRIITMVAFLLEARLLQLAWSSRVDNDNRKSMWLAEKKAVCFSLPLYVGGALIALLIHPWQHSLVESLPRGPNYRTVPFWGDMKSFAGLVLDAFLLPQILFNVFSDSKEKALAASYYVGITMIRLLPHAYDLYRAHSSAWKFDRWYFYASPVTNYYSTAWDIIVSSFGLMFVVVVCLQQRFGGRWVLPKKLSESVAYEKVPAVAGGE